MMNESHQNKGLSDCIPALSGRDFGLVWDELEGDRVLRHLQNHQNVVRRLALYVDAIDFHHLKYIIIKIQGGPSASGKKYVDMKFKVPSPAWVTR